MVREVQLSLDLIREENIAKNLLHRQQKQCDETTVYLYFNKRVVTSPASVHLELDRMLPSPKSSEIYALPASIFETEVFQMRPVPSLYIW